jgi:SAM-dependent methyltransferase
MATGSAQGKTRNINDEFFQGYYKEIWKQLNPPGLTKAEVNFMINYFSLKAGDKVLDMMCGYGRHALVLARTGIRVAAVDNLQEYINEIAEVAKEEMLPLQAIKKNILEFEGEKDQDLVICMGNNLSFFPENETFELFSIISSHLKPGGKFLTNSWMLTEIVSRHFPLSSSSELNGMNYRSDSRIMLNPARIETNIIIQPPGMEAEQKTAIDYLYTIFETESLLEQSGLRVKEIFSIPGRKKFEIGDTGAYIVAEKIQN